MFQFALNFIQLLLLAQINILNALIERANILNGQIVGFQCFDSSGTEIVKNIGEFPYMAAIDHDSDSHLCGGVIVETNAILTVNDCIQDYNHEDLSIRAGTLDLLPDGIKRKGIQTLRVEKITPHPEYNAKTGMNNIAILWLDGNLKFTNYVNKVTMSKSNGKNFKGETLTILGWGGDGNLERMSFLQSAEFAIVNCRATNDNVQIPNTVLCAKDLEEMQTACPGDDGGPLIQHYPGDVNKDILVGLIASTSCNSALPTIFTDIGKLQEWIFSEIWGTSGKSKDYSDTINS